MAGRRGAARSRRAPTPVRRPGTCGGGVLDVVWGRPVGVRGAATRRESRAGQLFFHRTTVPGNSGREIAVSGQKPGVT